MLSSLHIRIDAIINSHFIFQLHKFSFEYSLNPISWATCFIFQVFSIWFLLIGPARIIVLTKSSTLITNLIFQFKYFCQNHLFLHFFKTEMSFSFHLTSVCNVKRHYVSKFRLAFQEHIQLQTNKKPKQIFANTVTLPCE